MSENERYLDENEDDTCDLDPSKKCDNCCKCIEVTSDYAEIEITEVSLDTGEKKD